MNPVIFIFIISAINGAFGQESCPKFCHLIYKKVCASDGNTYDNECVMRATACRTKVSLSFVKFGECDVDEQGAVVIESSKSGFQSIPSSSGLNGFDVSEDEYFAAADRCPLGCHKILSPVCGTDDKVYDNKCILEEVACIKRSNIQVKNVGFCESTPVTDGDIKRCDACTRIQRPVCGSDGKTYSNECELRRHACLKLSDLTMVSMGECSSEEADEEDSNEFEKRSSSTMVDSDDSAEPPKCRIGCPKIFRPVCGSDDKTYDNVCILSQQKCLRSMPQLRMKNTGKCDSEELTENDHLRCSRIRCSKVAKPVCANNNVTYSNECSMRLAGCLRFKVGLQVSYQGPCRNDDETTTDPISTDEAVIAVNKREAQQLAFRPAGGRAVQKRQIGFGNSQGQAGDCPDVCIEIFSPVCGSNDVTYDNKCKLRVASCRNPTEWITLAHEGRCEDSGCPDVCPAVFQPVCGTDDVTYSNECTMRVIGCKKGDRHLRVKHDGECKRECRNFCTLEFKPVCGSNGQTYSNRCVLEVADCQSRNRITIVNQGPC